MKLAVAVLSVIVLTSYAALATNTPHQQGYELNREQAELHGMEFPSPRTSPATTQVKTATELIQSPGTSGALEFTIWTQREFNVFLMSGEEEKEDVLVHIEGDYYYQILILRSKKFGERWTWAELAGFTLERGTLTLRVEIGESAFSILGNGINLATYEYKEGLSPPVEKVAYYGEPGELKAITTYF